MYVCIYIYIYVCVYTYICFFPFYLGVEIRPAARSASACWPSAASICGALAGAPGGGALSPKP